MTVHNSTANIAPDISLRDFITPDSPNIYTFAERPTNQFRFDCEIHEI